MWTPHINLVHFVKVKLFRVLLVKASHFLDFFRFFDLRPNDLIKVFCVKLDHVFFLSELYKMFLRAQNLDLALQYEITLITGCAISENCLFLLKLFEAHGFVALMDCDLVSLLLEVVQKFVLEEEKVESFRVDRFFL